MAKAKSTHVLVFKGNGSWKDSQGVIYPQGKEIRVQSELSEDEFLNSRKDIKFMVNYGQLTIATATAGGVEPSKNDKVGSPNNSDKEPPKVAPKIVNTNK